MSVCGCQVTTRTVPCAAELHGCLAQMNCVQWADKTGQHHQSARMCGVTAMTGTHLLVTGGSLSPFVSSQNFEPAESLLSHQTVLVADTTQDPLRFSVRQAAGDVPAARFGPGHLMYHGERRGEPGEGCAGASRVGVSWCEWCGGERGGVWGGSRVG